MRKDGLKEAALHVGYAENGKRIIKHFYGRTKKEAERKRDEYKARLNAGLKTGDCTVSDWIDEYASVYGIDGVEAYCTRLKAAVGKLKIKDVTEKDLQKALNSAAGMSQSYLNKYRQTIKRIFKRARINRLIYQDPAEDLPYLSGTSGTHRALAPWEYKIIFEHGLEHRCGLWMIVMLAAGLRRGEMIALQWDCIDLTNRVLHVRRTAFIENSRVTIRDGAKTDAGIRDIPISDALLKALQTVPSLQRAGFVCRSASGAMISETAFKRGMQGFMAAMQKYAPDGERFEFRAHDLRHTFATALHDAGVDVKAAQYWLGHADIRMTLQIYTHLSEEKQRTSAASVNRFMSAYLNS